MTKKIIKNKKILDDYHYSLTFQMAQQNWHKKIPGYAFTLCLNCVLYKRELIAYLQQLDMAIIRQNTCIVE